MRLLAVGRLRDGPEFELYRRYAGRLRPALTLTEVAEARGGSATERRRRDGEALLALLPAAAIAVPLDLGGVQPDSEGLAALLQRWLVSGRQPCFLIGGADGLAPGVLAHGELVLSLGALTWPHMLVRAMLAEQLFRAQAILSGHPYHRADRP